MSDVAWSLRSYFASFRINGLASLMMAAGMGATLAGFAVFDRALFRPLPYAEPDRLAHVHLTVLPLRDDPGAYIPYEIALELQRHEELFQGLAWADGVLWPMRPAPGQPPLLLSAVTPNALDVLGVQPVVGRAFVPDSVGAGEREVLLSYHTWRSRFGGTSDLSHVSWRLHGLAYRVVGVLPADFLLPSSRLTKAFDGVFPDVDERLAQNQNRTYVIGPFVRLQPGVSIEAARAAVSAIAVNREWATPGLREDFAEGKRRLSVTSLQDGMSMVLQPYPWLITLGAWLLLGLASANLSLLLLAKLQAARHDRAIRLALGASSAQIARLSLMEAAWISLVGGGGAITVYIASYSALLHLMPAGFQTFAIDTADARLVGVTLALPAFCALVAAAVPAWESRSVHIAGLLRSGSDTHVAPLRHARGFLLISTAVSVMAIVLALAATPRFLHLLTRDPGFDPDDLFVMTVNHGSAAVSGDFSEQIGRALVATEGLLAHPDVGSAAVAYWPPFYRSGAESGFWRERGRNGDVWAIGAGLFSVLRTPILAGREFSKEDIATNASVAILNLAGVRALWPDTQASDALGRSLLVGGIQNAIIGVAADVQADVLSPAMPGVFVPIGHFVASQSGLPVIVRMRSDISPNTKALSTGLDALFGSDTIEVESVADSLALQLERPRFIASIFGLVVLASIVLLTVGHYGLTSYCSSQLNREVAVRCSLGASSHQIRLWLAERLIMPTLLGVCAGGGLGWLSYRLVYQPVLGVQGLSASSYAFATAVVLVSAFAIVWALSRNASRTDMAALMRD